MNSSSLSKAATSATVSILLGIASLICFSTGQPLWAGTGVAVTLAATILTFWFIRKSVNIIANYNQSMDKIVAGDYETRINLPAESGEIFKIGNNINNLVDLTDAFIRELYNSMEAVNKGYYYRIILERGLPGTYRNTACIINQVIKETEKRVMAFQDYADKFEADVNQIVKGVSDNAKKAEQASADMLSASQITKEHANNSAGAARTASENTHAVAAAAEELSTSIGGINSHVSNSSIMMNKAAEDATKTTLLINELSEASTNIGAIIGVINNIASQTHLLALNATIEAARAGEAGKSFAVVAGEVKTLASQTAAATEQITAQIKNVQDLTQQAAQATSEINNTLDTINDISSTIALGMGEQSEVTTEIARNIAQTSTSTTHLTSNIAEVHDRSTQSHELSQSVYSIARHLSQESDRLQLQIHDFLKAARAV